MTRKHFEAIAAAIVKNCGEGQPPSVRLALDGTAKDLAAIFADENPRFDSARFLAACGVES